jgi:hypothetical protein
MLLIIDKKKYSVQHELYVMRVSVGQATVCFQSKAANLPLPNYSVKPWPQNVKLARCGYEKRTLLNPHKHIALTVMWHFNARAASIEIQHLITKKIEK